MRLTGPLRVMLVMMSASGEKALPPLIGDARTGTPRTIYGPIVNVRTAEYGPVPLLPAGLTRLRQ